MTQLEKFTLLRKGGGFLNLSRYLGNELLDDEITVTETIPKLLAVLEAARRCEPYLFRVRSVLPECREGRCRHVECGINRALAACDSDPLLAATKANTEA